MSLSPLLFLLAAEAPRFSALQDRLLPQPCPNVVAREHPTAEMMKRL